MREIVFDTETTGLRHEEGERIIEIGAIELVNRFPSGRHFHVYINPDGRQVHPDALKVHGITNEFLADKPVFADIAGKFLEFIGDANLVAHNASFDMGFINAELRRIGVDPVSDDFVIDTLVLARRRNPMGPNSLDALCSRFGIDNSHRDKHGALLDAELLADVYIEMTGGRQATLVLDGAGKGDQAGQGFSPQTRSTRRRERPLAPRFDAQADSEHREFVRTLGENALWRRYLSTGK